jgi:hypothetical protein
MTDALERDLVDDIRRVSEAMGVFLVEIGQRRAKGSGTTIGCPDLAVLVSGRTIWVETKRHTGGRLSLGQQVFAERANAQGVAVFVVDTLDDYVRIVNTARRARGVERVR